MSNKTNLQDYNSRLNILISSSDNIPDAEDVIVVDDGSGNITFSGLTFSIDDANNITLGGVING